MWPKPPSASMIKCTELSERSMSLDMRKERSCVLDVSDSASIMGVFANSMGLPPGVLECTVMRIESEAV